MTQRFVLTIAATILALSLGMTGARAATGAGHPKQVADVVIVHHHHHHHHRRHHPIPH